MSTLSILFYLRNITLCDVHVSGTSWIPHPMDRHHNHHDRLRCLRSHRGLYRDQYVKTLICRTIYLFVFEAFVNRLVLCMLRIVHFDFGLFFREGIRRRRSGFHLRHPDFDVHFQCKYRRPVSKNIFHYKMTIK